MRASVGTMAEQSEGQSEPAVAVAPRRRKIKRRIAAVLALLLLAIGAFAWFDRERLADDFISSQLASLGLDAHYTIELIGTGRQILTNVVIGDPQRPDLTVERIEVTLEPRFPLLGVAKVRLVNPRLYGSYRAGKLSFGALDPLLFDNTSTAPFSFPDLELDLVDGRALIESDYGPVGFKAQGAGNLRGGFAGILAANAPALAAGDCAARRATLYGKIAIDAERPVFAGPLRLAALDCPGSALSLRNIGLDISTHIDRTLDGLEGDASLSGGTVALADNRAGGLRGSSKFTWRNAALTAQYQLGLNSISTPQLALDSLAAEGSVRAKDGFSTAEFQADLSSKGLRPGNGLDQTLQKGAAAAQGTLAGPMIAQIRTALVREGRGSALTAAATLRKTGELWSLVIPQANLRGSSGATLLALSRFQVSGNSQDLANGVAPRFTGNFSTGGAGLPQLAGRMESRGGSSDAVLRMRMAPYRVAGGELELPELVVAQASSGALGLSGSVKASGPLPGGSTKGLTVPISGSWSSASGLSMWRSCTTLEFAQLSLANLKLDKRRLVLCPPNGGAILKYDGQGMRLAAGTPSLDLTGTLGESPLRLKTGAIGLAWPGNLTARNVDVSLGPIDSAAQFRLSEVDARIASDIGGTFSGTEALLAAVPLDLLDASGAWRFAEGKLAITGGSFHLVDRQKPGRFEPLVARDATLSLADNRISAAAMLREPKSDREVVRADIVHDLANGTGHADLQVAGILFDDKLQPDSLSGLALGLIANAKGTVTGEGRIDWNSQKVTSHGSFGTSGLDFAAAFGPVQGVSGTIEFTDLLGMVTAPNQRLSIESFNPGIAVDRGELNFEIGENYLLKINGGRWPFIGGTLVLEPAQTRMTEAEERRYTLRLEGVDAAQFIERMELANISASGTFDGVVPLVFDQSGGRIEHGHLQSRPPGGNVSYVGALTYEDMNPIANYAFAALKSLDFRAMDIDLDGSLAGEIVTKVRFDGIRQGAGTSQNIVTRQLAKLPLRFNVNIRAPFYRLINSFKAMYDPSYVRDPRQVGLIDAQGRRIVKPAAPPAPAIKPEDLPQDESRIQPPESEAVP